MGFWSSLVDTAANVGDWVANNAGSIASAASTIAKVGGLVLAAEDITQDDNILASLAEHIDRASGALAKLVKTEFPAPVVTSDSGAPQVGGPFDLPALWPEPTSAASAQVPPVISGDVNKFLALKRIPNSLGTNANATDVGQVVAQQIFSSDSEKTVAHIQNINVKSIPVDVETAGGLKITGGHVFYEVPVGNSGDTAWHSHLRLWVQTPQSLAEEVQADRKALFVRPPVTNTTGSSQPTSRNAVTVSVLWTGSRNVAPLMKAALDGMDDSSITYQGPSVVDGTKFTYQFTTPTDVGPAEVVAKLSQSINSVLPPANDSNSLPRMPEVKIVHMRTLIE